MAVDGMPEVCALSLDTVATVPKAMLTARITELSPARAARGDAVLSAVRPA